jgi:hypothetical protein
MWRDRETDRVTSPHSPVTREIGDPTVHPERWLSDAAMFRQLAAKYSVAVANPYSFKDVLPIFDR